MSQSPCFSVSRHMELVLSFALVIFTTISIRLTELPLWNDAAFFVNGERLMATHDAYAWLAGAKGIGNYVIDPFTRFLALVHNVTGLPLSDVGFWGAVS